MNFTFRLGQVLGKQAQGYMTSGDLVPNELMVQILREVGRWGCLGLYPIVTRAVRERRKQIEAMAYQ